MTTHKSHFDLPFACVIAAISVCSFAADTTVGSRGGSCTRPPVDVPAAGVNVPNYNPGSDEIPAPDPAAEAAERLWHSYQASVFEALSTSPDPHDWALATLVHIDFVKDSNATVRSTLINRAATALPDDPMVQWIALEQGQDQDNVAKTTMDAALKALQYIESDNAAVWNEVLVRAVKNQAIADEDAALARMATSRRFDTHFADLMRGLLETYRRHPVPDEYFRMASKTNPDLADQDIANFAAAMTTYSMSLPAFQYVVNACRVNPTTGEHADRARDCAAIGRTMATHGDTLIANRIGLAVLRVSRVFTQEDVQNARPDDWVYRQYTSIIHVSPGSEPQLEGAAYQNDWYETGSEMEAMRRMILRAGRSLTPPDDWVDDNSQFSDERLRSDEDFFKKQGPLN